MKRRWRKPSKPSPAAAAATANNDCNNEAITKPTNKPHNDDHMEIFFFFYCCFKGLSMVLPTQTISHCQSSLSSSLSSITKHEKKAKTTCIAQLRRQLKEQSSFIASSLLPSFYPTHSLSSYPIRRICKQSHSDSHSLNSKLSQVTKMSEPAAAVKKKDPKRWKKNNYVHSIWNNFVQWREEFVDQPTNNHPVKCPQCKLFESQNEGVLI